MGRREGYLSPTHFSIHCRVSFLSGLCLWSHRSLLLFSTACISSLSLLLSSLFSTKRTSLFSILHQPKGNSCLYRLSSHVFSIAFALCQVHSSMELFLPFNEAFLHMHSTKLSHISVIFPTSNLWKDQDRNTRF